ncbi:hypothetical protein RB195_008254 [Necator americanus]|uniref:SUN domain-containing protein n=1 Tax=Necator americanus TaxID=51031 RepID=A0ABR1CMR0_NECAM
MKDRPTALVYAVEFYPVLLQKWKQKGRRSISGMHNYESVRIPTNHLKPSSWERLCWHWDTLLFHASLLWSRWLWFLTPGNISRMGFFLVAIAVFKQAMTNDTLPMGELVRHEITMDSTEMIESRLERFEKQQQMWKHVYQEKMQEIENTLKVSVSEVRKEMEKAISELYGEMNKHQRKCELVRKTTAHDFLSFRRRNSEKLMTLENELTSQLADVKSRILTVTESIRTIIDSPVMKSANNSTKATLTEGRKRQAVNLASRSHGAYVVSHLISKATSSKSVLLNLVDLFFPLETYNFAITERTHITPSEAYCFDGSEGTLTIRLWANASVEAVEYEHDYWRDVVPISAPYRYDVMACMDHECEKRTLLGECQYPLDGDAGPAQICEMKNRSITTDQIQIVFRANHGQEYTCIYLLRVLNWTYAVNT